jgi:DNA-binding MarR family transcriptional regulator
MNYSLFDNLSSWNHASQTPARGSMPTKPPKRDCELADRIHSAAIHILRRVRAEDRASGQSPPRLSALSVLVFAGPQTISRLAQIEQVKAPTMSRLLKDMEYAGLISRRQDKKDERKVWIKATKKGERVMWQGRERRVQALAKSLKGMGQDDRKLLRQAARLLETIARTDS